MNPKYAAFVSVVIVTRNRGEQLRQQLKRVSDYLTELVSDYELVIVDNGSDDRSIEVYSEITQEGGLPNLQIYGLVKEVDRDLAICVGIENALGDFICIFDPQADDFEQIGRMLEQATCGIDVVFAENSNRARQGFSYRIFSAIFNQSYEIISGINLDKDAPQFRVLSRRVANYVLQHRATAVAYRHLPASGGFRRTMVSYNTSRPADTENKKLWDSFERGTRLMVTTSRAPLRIVTVLSLFGAVANILYSFYVIAISLFGDNVTAGWTTTSLQLSGMFLLISLVLLVLSEYILNMAAASNEGPSYHVATEFTSAELARTQRLNVEDETGAAARKRNA